MKNFLLLIIFVLSLKSLYSQQEMNNSYLTGTLTFDAKSILKDYKEPLKSESVMYSVENKKSPLLAGVLSALIPGAGEFYSGEYLRAGIFLALEATVVTTAIIYDNKGDRKTNEFQDYADAYTNPDHNWSAVRYAEWLNKYGTPDPETGEIKQIPINPDESLPPWERVNWTLLNEAENGSHKLPPHGEQQYYELIGKYHQYSSGWNDFTGGGNKELVSPNFIFYSKMRGDANDFYAVASTAVIGIYVNHFLSALDAVWVSIQHNKDIALKFRLENIQLTDKTVFYPTINLSYNF